MTRQPIPTEPVTEPRVDPRLLEHRVGELQRRLEGTWRNAFEEFSTEPSVETTVETLLREANARGLVTRNLAQRAGHALDMLDRVREALGDAALMHDQVVKALADAQVEASNLQDETLLRDARDAVAVKKQTNSLHIADMELQSYVQKLQPMLPALIKSVSRRVHACGLAMRRLTVNNAERALVQAEAIVTAVRERARSITSEEAPLLQLLDRMRALSGEALVLPVISWPNGTDPFRAPTLKD